MKGSIIQLDKRENNIYFDGYLLEHCELNMTCPKWTAVRTKDLTP